MSNYWVFNLSDFHPAHKQKKAISGKLTAFYHCTGGEARTPDTRFWRPVLYQLSYSRVCGCKDSVIFGIYKPIYEKILPIIRLIDLIH